uniref:Uncharacterized protein n=1 Tax=Rhizophora mucronata TaxID=61149 RepID=A0A2P2QIL8_RHIMU
MNVILHFRVVTCRI